MYTSTEVRSIQRQCLTSKDFKALEKEIKQTENSILYLRKQLEITEEKYEREKGHFQKAFDIVFPRRLTDEGIFKGICREKYTTVGQFLVKMSTKLQQQVICKDFLMCRQAKKNLKLLIANSKFIPNVFKPNKFEASQGKFKVYSSHQIKVLIKTLLDKFSQCFELYSVP